MAGKRRRWWSARGAAFVVALMVAGLVFRSESPDAHLEREIERIADEYGFNSGQRPYIAIGGVVNYTIYTYSFEHDGMGLSEFDELLEEIEDVCKGCPSFGDMKVSPYPPSCAHTSLDTGDEYKSISQVEVHRETYFGFTRPGGYQPVSIQISMSEAPPIWEQIEAWLRWRF